MGAFNTADKHLEIQRPRGGGRWKIGTGQLRVGSGVGQEIPVETIQPKVKLNAIVATSGTLGDDDQPGTVRLRRGEVGNSHGVGAGARQEINQICRAIGVIVGVRKAGILNFGCGRGHRSRRAVINGNRNRAITVVELAIAARPIEIGRNRCAGYVYLKTLCPSSKQPDPAMRNTVITFKDRLNR